MAVEGFPRLEKAFVFVFDVDPPVEIGTISSGSNLNYVRITGGRVTTVHTFSGPKLESTVMEGEDWISVDNDNKRFRLDVKMLITTNDNAQILFKYVGIVNVTPEITLCLGRHENASAVPFGNVVNFGQFQTGDVRYKSLENDFFVGSGRFVKNDKGTFSVEYQMSKVIP
ncbi:hypothetical protein BDZ91DRAFT_758590 [Kalaharituber pfeilii]|nr:hypothetical protein BDZ91DRAFT_758590 [Kalaharituber pfeilii]